MSDPKKRSEKRRMACVIAIRLTDAEMEALDARAKAASKSRSAYVRGLIAGALKPYCEICRGAGFVTRSTAYPGTTFSSGFSMVQVPCPNGCPGPILYNVAAS